MRLKVPITGKVLEYDPVAGQIDGIGVVGDPKDPVKPININLGNISWRLVTIDLENDLAEIEVSPGENIAILKAGGNPDNPNDWTSRLATKEEKQGFLDNAKSQIESHTVDELYTMSKSKKLIKTARAVKLYKQKPPNVVARERLMSQG
ncbi:hypothetical protein ES708_10123 [subsurface metagenome]